MNIFKYFFDELESVSRPDTSTDDAAPDPYDIWAFTAPDARDRFAREGKLQALEHDIRYEVMRGEPWQPEELEYEREIRRLLRQGAIVDKGTCWFTSPFPTVYRAIRSGSLTVAGKEHRFQPGDDIVFQCRMTRDMNSALTGPLLIARLRSTDKAQLCGEMGGAMKGKGESM